MAKWEKPAEEVDALLRAAIGQKRLVELVYLDKRRIVEPHDYGVPWHGEAAGLSGRRFQQWQASQLAMDGSELDLRPATIRADFRRRTRRRLNPASSMGSVVRAGQPGRGAEAGVQRYGKS